MRVPRTFKNDLGQFQYNHIKHKLFFGFGKPQNLSETFLMAEPEKALLDLWYLSSGPWTESRISISIKDNWIICTITDNGIGRKKASALYSNFPEGHLAIATSIAEKRLKDYNASSDPSPLDFEDLFKEGDPCGTSVTIRIKIYI
jgi:hypothetical protein